MEKIVLIVHVLTALAIIATILLQQGKGAEAGASFGSGASQTVFGSAGGWNFFSRVTAIMATVFFLTSFGLAYIAKNNASVDQSLLPELEAIRSEAGILEDIPQSEIDVVEEVNEIPALQNEAGQVDVPDQIGEIPSATDGVDK